MSQPIFDIDQKLVATLQVESKYRLRKINEVEGIKVSTQDQKMEGGVMKMK